MAAGRNEANFFGFTWLAYLAENLFSLSVCIRYCQTSDAASLIHFCSDASNPRVEFNIGTLFVSTIHLRVDQGRCYSILENKLDSVEILPLFAFEVDWLQPKMFLFGEFPVAVLIRPSKIFRQILTESMSKVWNIFQDKLSLFLVHKNWRWDCLCELEIRLDFVLCKRKALQQSVISFFINGKMTYLYQLLK